MTELLAEGIDFCFETDFYCENGVVVFTAFARVYANDQANQ